MLNPKSQRPKGTPKQGALRRENQGTLKTFGRNPLKR